MPLIRSAMMVFCSELILPLYPEWGTDQGEGVDPVVRRHPMAPNEISRIRQSVYEGSGIANLLREVVRLRLAPHDWV